MDDRAVAAFAQLLDTVDPGWPDDEGLRESPARMAKAWAFWTSGYGVDTDALLKTFPAPAFGDDDATVIVRDLPFFSLCEHHGAPFFGTATIAYLPQERILGLSKLGRLVDAYARRLQVQERLTQQISTAIFMHEELECAGVAVMLKARHLCMESRGLCKQGQETITTSFLGDMSSATKRAEFLSLASPR